MFDQKTIVVLLLSAAVVVVAGYLFVAHRRLARDGRWHPVYGKDQMFRWVNGNWQYRDMTREEIIDSEDRRAW